MQVILLERVEKLGQMGDVVKVKQGFARNYLLPRKKALRATQANIAHFAEQKAQLEARNLQLKKEAEQVAGKLDKKVFVVVRQAGETGMLYGSVSTRDVADVITAGGFTIARNQIALDKPIKELGMHPVRVILHPEVRVGVTLNIARSVEEAERQARGENILAERTEAEEALADAEAMFEKAPEGEEPAAEEPKKEAKAKAEPKKPKAEKKAKAEEDADAEEAPTKKKKK